MEIEFTYTATFCVDEEAFDEMYDEIKAGKDVEEVVDEYIEGLDDPDYYSAKYIRDELVKTMKIWVDK